MGPMADAGRDRAASAVGQVEAVAGVLDQNHVVAEIGPHADRRGHAHVGGDAEDHDPADPEGGGFGLIFAECHINYRAPVHYDDQVGIGCSVSDVQRSSFRVPFRMHVAQRLVAEGYGVLVGFDYAAQRAAPLPEALRATLTA